MTVIGVSARVSSTMLCANLCLMGNDCPGTIITDTISHLTCVVVPKFADLHRSPRGFAPCSPRVCTGRLANRHSNLRYRSFRGAGQSGPAPGARQFECRDVEVEERTDLGAPGPGGGCCEHPLPVRVSDVKSQHLRSCQALRWRGQYLVQDSGCQVAFSA